MIRNYSMKIGEVCSGPIEFTIELCANCVDWSAANRDYDFYVIRSMFNP